MKTLACAVVKNEERALAEWVAFHLLVGFDTIMIFDNGSSDRTAHVTRSLGAMFDIRYRAWPEMGERWQLGAYDEALRSSNAEFDWIAFLDMDEFLLPLDGGQLRQMLASMSDTVAAVAVPWMMFGSSGHDQRPAQLITEAYTRRSEQQFGPNQHVKSIVRPTRVERALNPHIFAVVGAEAGSTEGYVGTLGEPVQWLTERAGVLAAPAPPGRARVNHYFVRSRAEWEAKVARGYNGTDARRLEDFEDYDQNVVEDYSAHPYVVGVKQILRRANLGLFADLPFE